MHFTGKVTRDGTGVVVYDRERWSGWLEKHPGQSINFEVLLKGQPRSGAQNRYWWGVIVPFFQQVWQEERQTEVPYPKEVVHDVMVRTFVDRYYETPLGTARPSTAQLTTAEFTKLIDDAREYAWQKYQSRIPEPEEA